MMYTHIATAVAAMVMVATATAVEEAQAIQIPIVHQANDISDA